LGWAGEKEIREESKELKRSLFGILPIVLVVVVVLVLDLSNRGLQQSRGI
jgi:hypothetical protein